MILYPLLNGVALHISEWAEMKRIVESINNDHTTLATTQIAAVRCPIFSFVNLQLLSRDLHRYAILPTQ